MDRKNKNITARKHRPDYSVVLTVAMLLLIGIVVLFSIGPALEISTGITVGKQFLSIALHDAEIKVTQVSSAVDEDQKVGVSASVGANSIANNIIDDTPIRLGDLIQDFAIHECHRCDREQLPFAPIWRR